MSRFNGSWQMTSLHVDGRGRADCLIYPARTPILEVAAGHASMKVTLNAGRVEYSTVVFAQELAQAARLFAAEVERMWHESHAGGEEV
ncbi:hypothetical protein, partial [Bailinhaonella thermotolerans]